MPFSYCLLLSRASTFKPFFVDVDRMHSKTISKDRSGRPCQFFVIGPNRRCSTCAPRDSISKLRLDNGRPEWKSRIFGKFPRKVHISIILSGLRCFLHRHTESGVLPWMDIFLGRHHSAIIRCSLPQIQTYHKNCQQQRRQGCKLARRFHKGRQARSHENGNHDRKSCHPLFARNFVGAIDYDDKLFLPWTET